MDDLTVDQVREIEPRARSGLVGPTVVAINKYAARYGVDTPLRLAHFLGQIIHESAGLTTFEELGGRSYFAKYEGSTSIGKRLGNVQAGDGYRFRGRGPIQCTGRANYALYGKKLGVDLIEDPERAADPDVGVRIALEYWRAKSLNVWADRNDVREITRRINGGLNGLADREHLVTLAKDVLGVADAGAPAALLASYEDDVTPDAAIAAEPPKSMMASREGLASLSIGGLSLAEIWDRFTSFAGDNLSLDTFLPFIHDHPIVLVMATTAILAGLIWYWRWRRMHE